MGIPRIEPLIGVANGVNVNFETTYEYRPGTVRVFINGLLSRQGDLDGWSEVGFRRIRLNEAPRDCDTVSAYYVIA